jgi:MATE family multidrug resistance protein
MTAPAAAGSAAPLRLSAVLAIAVPIMASNATTPLIGFVDAAVIGQLGRADLIGGVAVAAAIFNAILWLFGFLRMGTTGFTAQAVGAGNCDEIGATLARALVIALVGGIGVVVLQVPILRGFLWFIGGSPQVQDAASVYYDWRIWGVPAGLINFALLGWFIGLGRASVAFWLQFLMNVANIVVALVLTLWLGWGVAGVGAAALVSEVSAAVIGLLVAYHEAVARGVTRLSGLWNGALMRATLAANRDILIRTACVLGATQVVTAQGAQAGDVTLAANALLLNIVFISFYLIDGFAYAAETLVGQAVGAGDRDRLGQAVTLSTKAAGVTGAVLSLAVWLGAPAVIAFMTPSAPIREAVALYLPWAALTPILGVWCFMLDGIFIGATRTVDMRNMMLVSFAVFLAACLALVPLIGNHGLWAALLVFYIVRALTLGLRYPALAAGVGARA